MLAEETGGFATIDANSLSSAFDRIVDSNSRYYVLGYTPPDDAQNGRFHKIDVRVKRPGMKVIARRGYATPRAQTLEDRKRDEARRRAREARRPDGDTTSTELRGVLESALQQRGVSMSVQAAPFRNRDNEASVALAIEVDGSAAAAVAARHIGSVVLQRERPGQSGRRSAERDRSGAEARHRRAREDRTASG